MTAREAFGVVIRIAGTASVLAGAIDLFHVVAGAFGWPVFNRYPLAADALAAAFYAVFGLAIIVGADLITRLVYGRPDNSN
jgi:hypothetical protein